MQWLTEGLIILTMLVVNAVFAAYEMALASVSRARLEALAQLNRHGAHAAVQMKEHLERSLAVVQVGITLAGAIAAATGGTGVDEYLAPVLMQRFGLTDAVADFLAVSCLVIPLSGLTIVFAELVPKMFAIRNNERVILLLSPTMRWISRLFYPAIFLLETTVKRIVRLGERASDAAGSPADGGTGLRELRAAAALARASRLIGAMEERIVTSAVQFSGRHVREIMQPAEDITTISEQSSLIDALVEAHLHMHTRYPTCREKGNPQTITGYVNFKDIVATLKTSPASPGLKGIIRPIYRMEARATLAFALEKMVRESVHIAVVTDENGAIAGLVTLENLVEQLVGAIDDEYDRLPSHLQPLAQGWIVGGGAPMRALCDATGVALPADVAGSAALASWFEMRHREPFSSDTLLRADGFEVGIRKIRRHRIMEAVVRLDRPTAPSSAPQPQAG